MLDQYGDKVPDDLVLLPTSEFLDDADIDMILSATWYKVNYAPNHYCLTASFRAIDELSEDSVEDGGIINPETTIERIDGVLHRYSEEDGFYHA